MTVDGSERGTHDHANVRQLALLLEELCRLTPAVISPAGPNAADPPLGGPTRLERPRPRR